MADPMNVCTYSPQIAPGNGRIMQMPAEMRPITKRQTVILTYEDFSITLPAPNLRNKFLPKITRVQREARGGELIIFRDPVWSKVTVFNWAFEGLTASQAEGCLEFTSESCGDVFTILDFESRTIYGIMINPNNPISQEKPDSRNPDCSSKAFTWKLDFQGVFA